ncbi:MAG: DUF447 family protein [Planctomycetia bacterium]|nr:DUF447 family protein [Planctomycetia bacterium]
MKGSCRGKVLLDCHRYYEFRVTGVDDQHERVTFRARTIHRGTIKEFFGFNRARHAVLETAIIASRMDFLPVEGLSMELEKYKTVVGKTGDRREVEAFGLLENHIRAVALRRGFDLGVIPS